MSYSRVRPVGRPNFEPSVTIGLPVVDGFDQFRQAVRSVFAQDYQDWELIIVCDGSTADIVGSARAINDRRVKVVIHPERLGLPIGLNEITKLARAEIVVRMDSDDVMHPSRVGRLARYLEENPHVDVVGSGSYLVDESYQVLGSYREPELPSGPAGFLNSGVFSHPTVAYKRQWGLHNPYDPLRTRTEDKELWMRTFKHSNFRKIDDRLLFCMVPRQLSQKKQALTARFDRKLLWEVGRCVAPTLTVVGKVFESYIKQGIFALAFRLNFVERLHRRKYVRLDRADSASAQAVLNGIRHIPVPGWLSCSS